MADQNIIATLEPYISAAKQWQGELSAEREKFYRAYRAMPYGNERDGWAKTVNPTIFDVVEWIKPGLYEIFTGDFFEFSPKPGSGTAVDGTNLKRYVRHKLFEEQDLEESIEDWIHEALTSHYGVFKVTQRDDYKYAKKEFDYLSFEDFELLNSLDDVEVTKFDECESVDGATWYENVTVKYKEPEYIGPWVEQLPARELYTTPGYKDINSCPLVAHVVRRNLDYIRRQEVKGVYEKGSYDKVKNKLAGNQGEVETEGESNTFFTADGVSDPSTALDMASTSDKASGNNEVLIWECYCKLDIDGDGLLEPAIVTICEDVVLMGPIENPYKNPPFVTGTIHKEPGKLIGRPEADILDGWQRTMTNIMRAIQDSAMLSANRGFITSDRQTQAALQRWSPGTTAFVSNMNAFQQVDFGAPNQFIFKAYEMLGGERDKASGINEAFMGLDQNALNKTAAGMGMKLTASQQKQKQYARRLARAMRQVLRKVVDIVRIFPPEDDMRVVGKDIVLSEEDINGRYSVEIDVGVGHQEKIQKAQIIDSVIQWQMQAGLKLGLCNSGHIIKAQSDKLDYLDMSNAGYFYTEEELKNGAGQQPPRQPGPGGTMALPGGAGQPSQAGPRQQQTMQPTHGAAQPMVGPVQPVGPARP